MKQYKKIITTLLACSFLVTSASGITVAAKKPKLSFTTLVLSVGQKKSVTIKNKKSGAAYSFKSSKTKRATVSKKGLIKAKAKGKVTITVTQKYKNKTSKVGAVKVTIKSNEPVVSPTIPTPSVPTGTPTTLLPNVSPTVAPTAVPTAEPTLVPTQEPIIYPSSFDAPSDFDTKVADIDYGTVNKISYYSSVTGKTRKANVILPPNYSYDKKYPVLYLLHGIGGNEDEWLGGNPNEIVSNLLSKGEAEEMIMVIPNVRAGADDSYPSDNAFSLEHYAKFDNFIYDLRDCLMPYMEDTYSIATGRDNTAIAGLSMGGRESLYIGLNMLDTFGYVGAFSPGYGVFEYEANGVHENGLFTEESFTVPEEFRNNTFLMVIAGTNEGGINSVGGKCHNAFINNDVNHWWYTPVGGHDFVTWKNGLYNFARNIFH